MASEHGLSHLGRLVKSAFGGRRLRAGVVALLLIGGAPATGFAAPAAAQASAAADAGAPVKPPPGPQSPIPQAVPSARGGSAGGGSLPAAGAAPHVLSGAALTQIVNESSKGPAAPSATAAPLPAHGTLLPPPAAAGADSQARASYWNGSTFVVTPASPGTPRANNAYLGIPAPQAPTGTGAGATPSTFYGSKQVDTLVPCGFGANEASVAQSNANPNQVVVVAQMYQNGNNTCGDAHAWAFYSHDGGQHWAQTILPGINQNIASGDTAVTYDPKHNKFVFSFLEFNRNGSFARIGVESSSDGQTWGLDTTLDSCSCDDKDMIAVDQNPSSPHYGRVAVTWTEFGASGIILLDAVSDDGGATWTRGAQSINFASSSCGNGTSPAFDANGELMAAWWDCDTTPSQQREELSADGGLNWLAPVDTVITSVNAIDAGGCQLNLGGTAFRCNSFPSLAGDPNSADDGGRAFQIVWADLDSGITDSRFPNVTATISEIRGVGTTNGGGTWNGGNGFGFNFMSFANFGDKFFPWIAFAPNGRMDVGFSDREDNASAGNPHGKSFDEHGTEASSFFAIHEQSSYVSFTDDGTLADPGGSTFIGDYAGIQSEDNNFDTFPVWTDVRGGSNNVRTMDLCYVNCYTFLTPYSPRVAGGSSFTDLYQFNTDSAFGGSGTNFWNAVGIREGADGTTVDDDTILYGNRYFNNVLTSSSFSPPQNDYLLENDNTGHSPRQPYFPQVHSFSTRGGTYSIEWAAGSIVLPFGGARADSMGSASVVRVYDAFLNTATANRIGLRPGAGNTSKYSLTLHSASRGNQQGRPGAAVDSGNAAAGQFISILYNTGADPSQFDGVVVVNNNGGSGSYTLYLDNAIPTGTLNINSGAAATNSVNVTLNLTASNPNAGDPVLDMAFSNDGVTFGAFQPFAATAAYTLPAGDGPKTVYVEYRNGAGWVSSPISHTITLDTSAPVTTASLSGTVACGAYLGQAVVTLAASDSGSGVASTVYQIDGGAVQTYTAPFTVSTLGAHTVTFHSTDNAGNVEATKSTSFTVVRNIGGRCLEVTSTPTGTAALAWVGGTVQAGYVIARVSQSGTTILPTSGVLPANTTSFTDTPSPTSGFDLYVVAPLDTSNNVLGLSDLLGLAPNTRAGSAPTNFSVELDQTNTATLRWTAPGGQTGYTLYAVPANGGATRTTTLPAAATSATDDTGGTLTFYLLVAMAGSSTLGSTDILLADPGIATLAPPAAGPTGAALVQAQAARATQQLQSGSARAAFERLRRLSSGARGRP